VLALTFDDGPHPINTPRLLSILARYQIKATFFVIGENARHHPDLVKRAADEGHEIGNHSWSHPKFTEIPEPTVQDELQRTAQLLTEITGRAPKLVRPPFGESTVAQRRWINNTLGCEVAQWSVDPQDWNRPGAPAIAHRVLNGTRNGSVILLHDVQTQTIQALPRILAGLLAKGFDFATVSELIAKNRIAADAASV